MTDYEVPRSWITSIAKISNDDFKRMIDERPDLDKGDNEFPLFKILAYWYQKYKETKTLRSGIAEMTDDEMIAQKMRKQNLLKVMISNMGKLYLFVPKAIAEGRMLRTLGAIANQIRMAISASAVELSKIGKLDNVILKSLLTENPNLNVTRLNQLVNPILQEPRRLIELLTKHYNQALKELYENSQNISWADEGNARMIQEKLLQSAEGDVELKELVDEFYLTSDRLNEGLNENKIIEDKITEEDYDLFTCEQDSSLPGR